MGVLLGAILNSWTSVLWKYEQKQQRFFPKTTLTLLHYLHETVLTGLPPQVAEANRVGSGTIKINEIC